MRVVRAGLGGMFITGIVVIFISLFWENRPSWFTTLVPLAGGIIRAMMADGEPRDRDSGPAPLVP